MKNTISLKENHEFRRLYHRGASSAGRHLVLYCRKNKLGCNRLGLTVSAKLGKAVQRNRVKRLFRELTSCLSRAAARWARPIWKSKNRCCGRSARTRPPQHGLETLYADGDPLLPPAYFARQTALLPLYPDLLAVCDRGD